MIICVLSLKVKEEVNYIATNDAKGVYYAGLQPLTHFDIWKPNSAIIYTPTSSFSNLEPSKIDYS